MNSFQIILLLSSTLSAPAAVVVRGQVPMPPHPICSSDGSSLDATYRSSLDSLLSSIVTFPLSTLSYGFLNLSTTQPDYVEVLGLCHADLTAGDCRFCLDDSGSEIKQSCPSEKQAVLFNENCTIRYSNVSIYGTVATSPNFTLYNPTNASNPAKHVQEVRNLLDSLRGEAAQGGPLRKYATGSGSVDSVIIYGMVQCTPDLSSQQCSDCLVNIIGMLPQCCTGKIGARVFSPSCQLRFETNSRFFDPIPNPVSPTPLPSSPPTTPTTPTTTEFASTMFQRPLGSNSAKTWIIIVASTISAALNIVILVFLVTGRKALPGRRLNNKRPANEVSSAISEI